MKTRILGVIIYLLLGACQSVPDRKASSDWADRTLYAESAQAWGGGLFSERLRAIQQAKQEIVQQFETQILALTTDSGKTVLEQVGNNSKKIAAYVRRAEIMAMTNRANGVHLKARLYLGDSFKALLGWLPYKEKNPPPINSPGA